MLTLAVGLLLLAPADLFVSNSIATASLSIAAMYSLWDVGTYPLHFSQAAKFKESAYFYMKTNFTYYCLTSESKSYIYNKHLPVPCCECDNLNP